MWNPRTENLLADQNLARILGDCLQDRRLEKQFQRFEPTRLNSQQINCTKTTSPNQLVGQWIRTNGDDEVLRNGGRVFAQENGGGQIRQMEMPLKLRALMHVANTETNSELVEKLYRTLMDIESAWYLSLLQRVHFAANDLKQLFPEKLCRNLADAVHQSSTAIEKQLELLVNPSTDDDTSTQKYVGVMRKVYDHGLMQRSFESRDAQSILRKLSNHHSQNILSGQSRSLAELEQRFVIARLAELESEEKAIEVWHDDMMALIENHHSQALLQFSAMLCNFLTNATRGVYYGQAFESPEKIVTNVPGQFWAKMVEKAKGREQAECYNNDYRSQAAILKWSLPFVALSRINGVVGSCDMRTSAIALRNHVIQLHDHAKKKDSSRFCESLGIIRDSLTNLCEASQGG